MTGQVAETWYHDSLYFQLPPPLLVYPIVRSFHSSIVISECLIHRTRAKTIWIVGDYLQATFIAGSDKHLQLTPLGVLIWVNYDSSAGILDVSSALPPSQFPDSPWFPSHLFSTSAICCSQTLFSFISTFQSLTSLNIYSDTMNMIYNHHCSKCDSSLCCWLA